MKNETEIKVAITALQGVAKNPIVPKGKRADAKVAIRLLKWVLSDDPDFIP